MASSTITTPVDLISLCLRTAGVIGIGQTADPEDVSDCFIILNTILSEWQVQRWYIQPLIDLAVTSTAAVSYSVGPGGNFDTLPGSTRPDRIDAVFATFTDGTDQLLLPFMSREGYDRVVDKTLIGAPESYFYDPSFGAFGNLYLYPVPSSSYTIHVNCKASLGQFTGLTEQITLPAVYLNALQWNLSSDIRPLYQLPEDPQITQRAARSLQALINSTAQVPQVVTPRTGNRGGAYAQFPVAAELSAQASGKTQ